MRIAKEYLDVDYIETRGRKIIPTDEVVRGTVERFIAWVEGRYTPRSEAELEELYLYGEEVYPALMNIL